MSLVQRYARIFKGVLVKRAGFRRDMGILGRIISLNKCVNHETKSCS